MSRQIICTVGTSLLTNPNRPWAGWKRGQPNPLQSEVDTWLQHSDAVQASAETNTLQRLALDSLDMLAFLHSDTPEGLFAERLKFLFRDQCREVSEDIRPGQMEIIKCLLRNTIFRNRHSNCQL